MGSYGGSFDIFSESYYYEVEYLDDPEKSYRSKNLKIDLDAIMTLDFTNRAKNFKEKLIKSKDEL